LYAAVIVQPQKTASSFSISQAEFKKYAATVLLVVLGLGLLYLLRIFFLAIFGAYVFSILFSPFYIWMKGRIRSEEIAALLTILVILIVALVPLFLVLYTAFNQAITLQDKFDPKDFSSLFSFMGPQIQGKADQALQRITQDISNSLAESLPSIFNTLTHLGISIFLMFFVMYYIFLNIHYILIRSAEYLPFNQTNAIWLVRQFEHISRAILLGQLLISCIQGLIGGIGFFIFKVPDAVLWGIVMAILSLVPVVGTSLVWLPAAAYYLAHQDYFTGFGLLLWGGVLVSHIDNIIRPLLGKKLGNINPIVMMLGAFAGLEFFGIIGVVLGPFLLAFFFLLLQVYRQEYLGHPIQLSRAQILTEFPED